MDEYVKAALSGSVVGAVTGAAELIPVGGLARAGIDFGAGAMGSAGSQMILDGKVEPETMFHEGALAAVMAMVGRRLRGGGEGGVGKGSVEGVDDGKGALEGAQRISGSAFGEMDLEDTLRYDQYWDDVKAGKYDIPYGMTDEKYYQFLKGLDKVDRGD